MNNYQKLQVEKAVLNSKLLKECGAHEFDLEIIKEAVYASKTVDWTRAKCKCKKCGGEVFVLYAGGYMDAIKQLNGRNVL